MIENVKTSKMSPMMANKLEFLTCDELRPYAKNSRIHSEEQIEQIMNSMKEFGLTNPILIDGENGIIAGHGRFEAALRLGVQKIPCIRLDYLSEPQKRAYIIADNKLAENATWDDSILSEELIALNEDDFDLDVLGFSEDELADLLPAEVDCDPLRGEAAADNVAEKNVCIECGNPI